MKKTFYSELAYFLGLVSIALGAAFMEKADFGMSMIVAPAYLIFRKMSSIYSFFTFGMAEYTLQGALLILMIIVVRRFKVSYLFSFVTAVIYGFILDGCMLLVGGIQNPGMALRIVLYIAGLLAGSVGVSLVFHTYIAPEVYELFVKEISAKTGRDINRVKTVYDVCSCLLGVVLSFSFFGLWVFEGVKWGTIVCAIINGSLIGLCTKLFERFFEFRDGLKLRRYF
ncbi:MAG: hypothetical protein IJ863_04485 [Spirochaetales bacterium]|nr:hypothetical protein [Spirochaetales bacterium]